MFSKFSIKEILLAILSGILLGVSFKYLIIFPAVIALVPLLLIIENKKVLQSFVAGLITGVVLGIFSYNMLFSLARKYTGSNTYIGVILILSVALFFGLQIGLFSAVYTYLINRTKKSGHQVLKKLITAASLWVLIEWLNMTVLTGLPWLSFSFAMTMTRLLYAIQLSSFTGPLGISFLVVIINVLIYLSLSYKNYRYVLAAVMVFLLNITYGYVSVNTTNDFAGTKYKIAALQENISAKTRWNSVTGDSLASIFLHLNAQAAKLNPKLIVWSESAIPWTFRKNDDLLRMSLEETDKTKATHLVGILSDVPNKKGYVYNSVYSISYNGTIHSIYNKNELLQLLEKPLFQSKFLNVILPFFTNIGYKNILPGKKIFPVYTNIGLGGVMICNESILPFVARETTAKGAKFLVNMSNDAWFTNSFLIELHFYLARLRAVENNRDLIINSNMGISGIIKSDGEIIVKKSSKTPEVISGEITLNNNKTFYCKFGNWIVYVLLLLILITNLKLTNHRRVLNA